MSLTQGAANGQVGRSRASRCPAREARRGGILLLYNEKQRSEPGCIGGLGDRLGYSRPPSGPRRLRRFHSSLHSSLRSSARSACGDLLRRVSAHCARAVASVVPGDGCRRQRIFPRSPQGDERSRRADLRPRGKASGICGGASGTGCGASGTGGKASGICSGASGTGGKASGSTAPLGPPWSWTMGRADRMVFFSLRGEGGPRLRGFWRPFPGRLPRLRAP